MERPRALHEFLAAFGSLAALAYVAGYVYTLGYLRTFSAEWLLLEVPPHALLARGALILFYLFLGLFLAWFAQLGWERLPRALAPRIVGALDIAAKVVGAIVASAIAVELVILLYAGPFKRYVDLIEGPPMNVLHCVILVVIAGVYLQSCMRLLRRESRAALSRKAVHGALFFVAGFLLGPYYIGASHGTFDASRDSQLREVIVIDPVWSYMRHARRLLLHGNGRFYVLMSDKYEMPVIQSVAESDIDVIYAHRANNRMGPKIPPGFRFP